MVQVHAVCSKLMGDIQDWSIVSPDWSCQMLAFTITRPILAINARNTV
jgi:hypothetical protein